MAPGRCVTHHSRRFGADCGCCWCNARIVVDCAFRAGVVSVCFGSRPPSAIVGVEPLDREALARNVMYPSADCSWRRQRMPAAHLALELCTDALLSGTRLRIITVHGSGDNEATKELCWNSCPAPHRRPIGMESGAFFVTHADKSRRSGKNPSRLLRDSTAALRTTLAGG